MIVAIHQPHYLPWLGFLDRMLQADCFILLDHVQFERRNYQNRTRILVDGRAQWLTVPVLQQSQDERVLDKLIDRSGPGAHRSWGARHFQTLRHAYRHAPYFAAYAPRLREILETPHERLVDLNRALLDFLRDAFEIRTPLRNSSELDVTGRRSGLILNLCRAAGADTLLAGQGGSRDYLNRAEFAEAGVELRFQSFTHPCYAQPGSRVFVAGLSAVDLLFQHGPASGEILRGAPAGRALAA